jgi:choline kinase
MRVIVLAAGQGYQLDGFNKLLIKHPADGKRIIERYLEVFKGKNITFVLGYRAINVMHSYPSLNYVYNDSWAVTNNSYSLSLAINDEPCYVVSGDLFFDAALIAELESAPPNLVATQMRDSRTLSAVNVAANENNVINETYQGKLRDVSHPEAVGIFKISDPALLMTWKRNCIDYGNLFVGQNIPFSKGVDIISYDVQKYVIDEVNTTTDYLRLLTTERQT